jgi:acyl carrier protein
MENRVQQIRSFIQDRIRAAASSSHQPVPELKDDLNLVETSLFDSIEFVQLISALEKEFDIEIDIGALDPEEFTVLGTLVRVAAESPTLKGEAESK